MIEHPMEPWKVEGRVASQGRKSLNLRRVAKRDRPALTPIEQRIFDRCLEAAANNLPAPSVETLTAEIGASAPSTVPGIMARLEAKGYITRTVYQRGRQICIVDLGVCTVPPKCLAPHWRTRPRDQLPTPAIHSLREKAQSLPMQIEQEAKQRGVSVVQMLADLVYIGFHAYQAEKEGLGG